MQINKIPQQKTNFRGISTNKAVLNILEKVSEHGTSFAAATSLAMSLTLRPLAIIATPDVEKENKQYACANSIGSGLIKFAMVEAIALPIEYAVKKIDKSPAKYLNPSTIKNFQATSENITTSKSYKLATQIIKLSTGFISAIPKSMLTIAFIPMIMDNLSKLKIFKDNKSTSLKPSINANKQSPNLSFTGSTNEIVAKGLGKILDCKVFQNFAKQNEANNKNIAKHMSAATDILLTSTFAYKTAKSDKIKEERKKALIYNNIISTAITLCGGYSIDKIVKDKTKTFIENFSAKHKNNPKLYKYIEGINIIRPTLIFAGIYYGIIPIISTYTAEKLDKKLNSHIQK